MPQFTLGGLKYDCPEFISPARKSQARDRLIQRFYESIGALRWDADEFMAWAAGHTYESELSQLEAFLTPCGAHTVAEGYDAATEEEVEEAKGFFSGATDEKKSAVASLENALPRRGKRSPTGTKASA